MTDEQKVWELIKEKHHSGPWQEHHAAEIGIQAAEWKEKQMIEKIKEFFSNCPRYLYLDKDVLNNNFLNREFILEDLLRELK